MLPWLVLLSTACGGAGVAADRLPFPGPSAARGPVLIGSNRVELLTELDDQVASGLLDRPIDPLLIPDC